MSTDTIVALSSGSLPCGVAVIRISGPRAKATLLRLAGSVPEPRRAVLRTLRDADGAILDRGLVIFFEGPKTVTGEDLAELHVHGGRAVVSACLEVAISMPGLRLAEPGEFTRRAFENGRIDLTEAEGLADLLAAETETQRRQAVAQSTGQLRRLYEDWMRRVMTARAFLEASLDFADESDVGDGSPAQTGALLEGVLADMQNHLTAARSGELVRDGFKVALAGRPNAGKSTLLNRLAERDVAIVSPLPGTTRDVIEVRLDLGGHLVRVFDMAGLRPTDDAVEAIGVERARTTIADAQLIVLMTEEGAAEGQVLTHVEQLLPKAPTNLERQATVAVFSKADLRPTGVDSELPAGAVRISALTGEGIDSLIGRIRQAADSAMVGHADAVPTRLRHRDILAAAVQGLQDATAPNKPDEVRAELLRRTTNELGKLTGQGDVEEVLGIIFGQFCVGK